MVQYDCSPEIEKYMQPKKIHVGCIPIIFKLIRVNWNNEFRIKCLQNLNLHYPLIYVKKF